MRTLLAVLTATVLANAAVPPKLEIKTYDVADLVGTDGVFASDDELLVVTNAFLRSWKHRPPDERPYVRLDGPAQLSVTAVFDVQDEVKEFLVSLRKVKERRNAQVMVECVLFTTSEGTGAAMLLPKEKDAPVTLTGKETTLTNALIRTTKAAGNLDVLSRPTLTLTHGHEGLFQVGQQFPEVVAKSANRDGSITQTLKYADVGLTHKVTATVLDGGGVKLVGSVSSSEVVKDKVRVTHKGEFTTELSAGGTAVARIPAVGSSGTEMYLMLTVTSVGPVKQAEPAKVVVSPYGSLPAITIPPVPPVDVPLPGIVPVGGQLLPPTKPSLGGVWEEMPKQGGVQFRFVAQNGQVLLPTVLSEVPPLTPPPLPTAIPPVK